MSFIPGFPGATKQGFRVPYITGFRVPYITGSQGPFCRYRPERSQMSAFPQESRLGTRPPLIPCGRRAGPGLGGIPACYRARSRSRMRSHLCGRRTAGATPAPRAPQTCAPLLTRHSGPPTPALAELGAIGYVGPAAGRWPCVSTTLELSPVSGSSSWQDTLVCRMCCFLYE